MNIAEMLKRNAKKKMSTCEVCGKRTVVFKGETHALCVFHKKLTFSGKPNPFYGRNKK
jgi:hypothetical protein